MIFSFTVPGSHNAELMPLIPRLDRCLHDSRTVLSPSSWTLLPSAHAFHGIFSRFRFIRRGPARLSSVPVEFAEIVLGLRVSLSFTDSSGSKARRQTKEGMSDQRPIPPRKYRALEKCSVSPSRGRPSKRGRGYRLLGQAGFDLGWLEAFYITRTQENRKRLRCLSRVVSKLGSVLSAAPEFTSSSWIGCILCFASYSFKGDPFPCRFIEFQVLQRFYYEQHFSGDEHSSH